VGSAKSYAHEGDHHCWVGEALTSNGLRLVEVDNVGQAELAELTPRPARVLRGLGSKMTYHGFAAVAGVSSSGASELDRSRH
jgi:hypothetical protein